MEEKFDYLKWENSFLLDSEITLFINNNITNEQEFYKIISVNNNIQFSSILKLKDGENRVIKKIPLEDYKKIWDFYFLIKPYALKNIYIYHSEEPISYLFSFRCNDKNKKIAGLGKIIQSELFQIYTALRKLKDSDD